MTFQSFFVKRFEHILRGYGALENVCIIIIIIIIILSWSRFLKNDRPTFDALFQLGAYFSKGMFPVR